MFSKFFPLLLISLSAHAEFSGTLEDRTGLHLSSPQDLSSNFQSLSLEEKISRHHWTGVFSGRAWNEGVYHNDGNEYPVGLASEDSHDFAIRDFYVQYKNENFFARIGNQQVVWGEAFGFFYSDIVNPKDFRDGGFRDFEAVRRPIPMVNLKYTLSEFSIQGIYVPKPYFNVNPLPGSDFAFPYRSVVPINEININRSDSYDARIGHDEYGGRLSFNMKGFDTSIFLFSYLDRSPYYQVDPKSQLPQSLTLDELHSRIVSYGLTTSFDYAGTVLRAEVVQTKNRNYANVAGSTLGYFTADENVYVIGIDLPAFEKISIGVQYSDNSLSNYQSIALRPQDESLASIRISRPFFRDHTAQIIYADQFSDKGSLLQFEYVIPTRDNFEIKVGSDLFSGPSYSQFGEIHRASRVYTVFKFWFAKI